MRTYIGQVIGGTRLDQQGERLPKQVLDEICIKARGSRLPVHQHHDMTQPIVGYMENLRVEADAKNEGEWSLVADVFLEEGTIDDAQKGFSISTVMPLREVDDAQLFLNLPYPTYNDTEFIAELSSDPTLKLGKWIKKNLDAGGWALFGATLAFILKPAWDDVYKQLISPKIDQFLGTHGELISRKGLGLEHVQLVIYGEHQIELRFIPAPGKEKYCFSHDSLRHGIDIVAKQLAADSRA